MDMKARQEAGDETTVKANQEEMVLKLLSLGLTSEQISNACNIEIENVNQIIEGRTIGSGRQSKLQPEENQEEFKELFTRFEESISKLTDEGASPNLIESLKLLFSIQKVSSSSAKSHKKPEDAKSTERDQLETQLNLKISALSRKTFSGTLSNSADLKRSQIEFSKSIKSRLSEIDDKMAEKLEAVKAEYSTEIVAIRRLIYEQFSSFQKQAPVFRSFYEERQPPPEGAQFQLFIKTYQRVIPIELKSSDTVLDVKLMIHKKERIHPDEQLLFFRGKKLEDRNMLAYYRIEDNSVLEFTHTYQVTIKGCVESKDVVVDIIDTDKVDKLYIKKKCIGGILKYKSSVLKLSNFIADYNITSSSVIFVTECECETGNYYCNFD